MNHDDSISLEPTHPDLPDSSAKIFAPLDENPWSNEPLSETPAEEVIFGVALVDFHHIRGPEIEYWIDGKNSSLDKISNIFPYLPFQALPDGAHLYEETFSNFTLLYDGLIESIKEYDNLLESGDFKDYSKVTTLFGCACIRQMSSESLTEKPSDVTRSTVQKSVVIVSRYPITLQLYEKLGIVTRTLFEQRDFTDKSLLKALFENLDKQYNSEFSEAVSKLKESDFYAGLCLQEPVMMYKRDLLVIFKALLLEKKIIFFSKDLQKLCNYQYSLLSLIPNLMLNLGTCGSRDLSVLHSKVLEKPNFFKSSDRSSVLRFLGLPLQIFDKGGFFQPYLSLQQLDLLGSTEWFTIGTSNELLLGQREKIADLVVYIDTKPCIEILSPDLKGVLNLSSQDKRFCTYVIDHVSKSVLEGEGLGFRGSEDFIRLQFEEYLISLLTCDKYDNFLSSATDSQLRQLYGLDSVDGSLLRNEISFFNQSFVSEWRKTENYAIWNNGTDNELFNMFEAKHCGNSQEMAEYLKNPVMSFLGKLKRQNQSL